MSASGLKRILVMMSTYNGEKHLGEQIESIMNQRTRHEVILRIRDDGSKDHTCDLIEEYMAKYPLRIELIRGENKGYNGSFFYLIQNAGGFDYYAISDQDDVWLPEKLQVACDAIDGVEEDIPLLYASTSYLVHDDLKPYGTTRKRVREMAMHNTIIQNICPGHTQVMNNRLLEKLKVEIDASRIYVYDSWIQNVANLYGRILFDNEPHTYYRQYEGNQLGSGAGKIGQLLASRKRTDTGDGHKYKKQIAYFLETYEKELKKKGVYSEVQKLVDTGSFGKRLNFFFSSKLYRQSRLESVAFRVAVLTKNY